MTFVTLVLLRVSSASHSWKDNDMDETAADTRLHITTLAPTAGCAPQLTPRGITSFQSPVDNLSFQRSTDTKPLPLAHPSSLGRHPLSHNPKNYQVGSGEEDFVRSPTISHSAAADTKWTRLQMQVGGYMVKEERFC